MKSTVGIIAALWLAVHAIGEEALPQRPQAGSPCHKWVKLEHTSGSVACFVTLPDTAVKAAVVLLHERYGLTPETRALACGLAEAGYLAVAPNLLSHSRHGDTGNDSCHPDPFQGGAETLPSPEMITQSLMPVVNHVANHPASGEKTAIAGFSWGGKQVFHFAKQTHRSDATLKFHSTLANAIQPIAEIECAVYGFLGPSRNGSLPSSSPPSHPDATAKSSRSAFCCSEHSFAGSSDNRHGKATSSHQARKADLARLLTLLQGL